MMKEFYEHLQIEMVDKILDLFKHNLCICLGQRWSELIDQLINEQSSISPSEKAQELLDTVFDVLSLRIIWKSEFLD